MQPKNNAVLFDLDGTLINSGLSFLKIVNELKEGESQDHVNFEIVRKFSSRGASLVLKNAFPDASDEKINVLISKFELEALQNIKAEFLSGGQKKRLILAMALLGDPELLLLDEPFSALDLKSIKTLQDIIINLQSERKISICITDHQAADSLRVCDSAIVLADGKVVAKGTPSELVKNENAINAYFGDSFKFN